VLLFLEDTAESRLFLDYFNIISTWNQKYRNS